MHRRKSSRKSIIMLKEITGLLLIVGAILFSSVVRFIRRSGENSLEERSRIERLGIALLLHSKDAV